MGNRCLLDCVALTITVQRLQRVTGQDHSHRPGCGRQFHQSGPRDRKTCRSSMSTASTRGKSPCRFAFRQVFQGLLRVIERDVNPEFGRELADGVDVDVRVHPR